MENKTFQLSPREIPLSFFFFFARNDKGGKNTYFAFVWVNTKPLVYPLALPRKARRKAPQLRRESLCLKDILLQGIILSFESWGSIFSTLSLHKHTENKLYKSIRHQGQNCWRYTCFILRDKASAFVILAGWDLYPEGMWQGNHFPFVQTLT